MHCDADCFYVSCEVARRPELKGKPVAVTSRLGRIVLAKSYDLKAMGVKTGAPGWELEKKIPNITLIEPDFEYYNHMSAKMFEILGRWTPDIEVYSVDEAFMDMKGFRKLYRMGYEQIAEKIKEDVNKHLGITVSVGVSVSKTLAKMAAEVNKPDGVTAISWRRIPEWLPRFHVSDVPGFGRNTVPLLEKLGIETCADFVNLTEQSVKSILHRPGVALWNELQGNQVYQVEKSFAPCKVITRTSSFAPLTADQRFLWAHTLRQLERAIDALNYDGQLTQELSLYLRDKDFIRYGWKIRLISPTKSFTILSEVLKEIWREHFPRGKVFRSAGVTMHRLSPDVGLQLNLFENPKRIIRKDELENAKHSIKEKYGRLAIRSASSLRLTKLGPNKKKPLRAKAFNVEW
jgi:DNA polymerase V